MRKFIGWAASWTLYYLGGYTDLAGTRFRAKWLKRVYFWLLNASDDAQTWGGGRGTWEHGLPAKNEYWLDFRISDSRYSRTPAHQKKVGRRRYGRQHHVGGLGWRDWRAFFTSPKSGLVLRPGRKMG